MLEAMFDSGTLPGPDRVEAWREITASALVPNEFNIERPEDFRATLRAAELGGAQLTAMRYASMESRRTPRLIRQSDPEMYAVGFITSGRQAITQARTQSLLTAGDIVVYSTSRPYEALVDAREGTATSVVVQVPRVDVPLLPDRVGRLLATRLSGREGVGRLLTGFVTTLATDDSKWSRPADDHRLGTALIDLITTCLAHHIESEGHQATASRQRVRLLEVRDFIRRHLADGELTPAAVAAAHHISLRALHRLFHDHGRGDTVAAYIRRQRLSGARHDLADPYQAARPVHAIAARWGFTRPPDFTRAFRAAYGSSPSEYRREAFRAQGGADCEGPGT